MTLNEIAYSLYELVRGDIKSGDTIDLRLLYNFIHTQRALWINKKLSENNYDFTSFEQDLGCVQVESIDTTAYCREVGDIGCNILQTVKNIPKPIFKKGKPLISRVGPIDRQDINFSFVSEARARFSGNGKFNKNTVFSFYQQPKIKLKSNADWIGGLEYINIKLVLTTPSDAQGFSLCCGSTCWTPDMPYPISEDLIDYLQGDIIKNKLSLLIDTPTDRENDSTLSLKLNGEGKK